MSAAASCEQDDALQVSAADALQEAAPQSVSDAVGAAPRQEDNAAVDASGMDAGSGAAPEQSAAPETLEDVKDSTGQDGEASAPGSSLALNAEEAISDSTGNFVISHTSGAVDAAGSGEAPIACALEGEDVTPVFEGDAPSQLGDVSLEQSAATAASDAPDADNVAGHGQHASSAVHDAVGSDAQALLPGDYQWRTEDSEGILRLRPNGQWWHAVHRTSTARGRVLEPGEKRRGAPALNTKIMRAYKRYGLEDSDEEVDKEQLRKLEGTFEEISVWELAESTGSWREVQVASEHGKHVAVLLTCEHCTWKTNYPDAPLSLCPGAEGQAEVDAMVDDGQLVLCYVLQLTDELASKSLMLHMDLSTVCEWTGSALQAASRHKRLRNMQTAFQTLGFARAYDGKRLTVETTQDDG